MHSPLIDFQKFDDCINFVQSKPELRVERKKLMEKGKIVQRRLK